MLKVAFEAVEVFWPVCGSYSSCADIWTPSRPPHRHGKPGDFGLLFFWPSLKFLAPRLKKYKCCDAAEHDREICLNPAVAILRRTWHCAVTARFLPPPLFFWRYTTPPCLKEKFGLFVDFEFLTEMGSWDTD